MNNKKTENFLLTHITIKEKKERGRARGNSPWPTCFYAQQYI